MNLKPLLGTVFRVTVALIVIFGFIFLGVVVLGSAISLGALALDFLFPQAGWI